MTHDNTEDRLEPLQAHRRPILKLAPYTLLGTTTLTQTTTVTAQDHNTVFHDFETQEINHEYTSLYGSHSEWDTDHHDDLNNRTAHVTSNNERPSFLILNPDTYEWYDRQASIDFKVNTQNWKRNARLAFVSGNNAWIITAAVQGDKIGIQYDAGITGNWTQVASYDYTITDTEPHTLHGWLSEDRIIAGIDDTQHLLEHEIDESITLGSVGFGVHGDIPVETWFDRFSVESWSKPSHPPQSGEQEIAAEITQFDTYGGEVDYGETVESRATVENTGDVEHTFFVGYSMFGPNGEEYNNDGGTGKPVPIQPGETKTVELQWEVRPGIPAGSYNAVTTVWEESDKSNLETDLHTRENPDAVRLHDDTINVEITDVQVQTETVEPGEEVQSTVVVQNNETTDQRCYIGYSVIAPDNRPFSNNGTTGRAVTLSAEEETTVDVSWTAVSTAPTGEYDVVTAVWEEVEAEQLETVVDRETRIEVFELVEGWRPAGTTVLPPSKPDEFPFTHTQEIEVDDDNDDLEPFSGDGVEFTVDREQLDERTYKLTVSVVDPEDSILSWIGGHKASQILIFFNNEEATLNGDEVYSTVDKGKTWPLVAGSFVIEVGDLAIDVKTGDVDGIAKTLVEFLSDDARAQREMSAVTSYLDYETPPSIETQDETTLIDIDFGRDVIGESLRAPIILESYRFEAEFTIAEDVDETTLSIISDMRGSSPHLEQLLHENPKAVTSNERELPVEYRHPVHVSLSEDSNRSGGREETESESMPGFGVVSALAGIGGAAYLLKHLRSIDDPDR